MSLFSFKCFSKNKSPTIDKNSLITVKRLWIRLPPGFGSKHTIDELYKKLGDNIPKYLEHEGGTGINIIFCIDRNLNIVDICKYFEIVEYSTTEFKTPPDRFNSSYQIHNNYGEGKEPYILSDVIY